MILFHHESLELLRPCLVVIVPFSYPIQKGDGQFTVEKATPQNEPNRALCWVKLRCMLLERLLCAYGRAINPRQSKKALDRQKVPKTSEYP